MSARKRTVYVNKRLVVHRAEMQKHSFILERRGNIKLAAIPDRVHKSLISNAGQIAFGRKRNDNFVV